MYIYCIPHDPNLLNHVQPSIGQTSRVKSGVNHIIAQVQKSHIGPGQDFVLQTPAGNAALMQSAVEGG